MSQVKSSTDRATPRPRDRCRAMVLPTSGPISLSNLATEFGIPHPIRMSAYYGLASGVPASGPMTISTFRGKSSVSLPSGIGLWLNASATQSLVVDNAGYVLSWKDSSGNNRDFSQSNQAMQPLYSSNGLNNRPCLLLTNSNGLVRTATSMGSLASSSNMTLYAVATTSNNPWQVIATNWLDDTGASSTSRFHYSFRDDNTTLPVLFAASAFRGRCSISSAVANTNFVTGFVYGSNDGRQFGKIFANGVNNNLTNYAPLPSSLATSNSMFAIGDTRGINFQCAKVAEVLMYDRSLNTAESAQVETYLRNKYGLTY